MWNPFCIILLKPLLLFVFQPKRKKSKQRRSEETVVLIESASGNECHSSDDIALSPLSPTFPEKEFLLKGDDDLQRDTSTSLLDTSWDSTGGCSVESAPPSEPVIEGLCGNVAAMAIAPEFDLMPTNFDNYVRKEDELPEESLPVTSEIEESRYFCFPWTYVSNLSLESM